MKESENTIIEFNEFNVQLTLTYDVLMKKTSFYYDMMIKDYLTLFNFIIIVTLTTINFYHLFQ